MALPLLAIFAIIAAAKAAQEAKAKEEQRKSIEAMGKTPTADTSAQQPFKMGQQKQDNILSGSTLPSQIQNQTPTGQIQPVGPQVGGTTQPTPTPTTPTQPDQTAYYKGIKDPNDPYYGGKF